MDYVFTLIELRAGGTPPTPSGGLGHKKTLWVSNGENTKDMHVEQSVFCDNYYHVSPGILRKKNPLGGGAGERIFERPLGLKTECHQKILILT